MLDVGGVKVFGSSISVVTASRVVWDILLSQLIQVCTKLTFAIKNTTFFTIKYFGM